MKEIKQFTKPLLRDRRSSLSALIRSAKVDRVYVLTKGVDFKFLPGARSTVYTVAKAAGLQAHTSCVNGNIEFCITKKRKR